MKRILRSTTPQNTFSGVEFHEEALPHGPDYDFNFHFDFAHRRSNDYASPLRTGHGLVPALRYDDGDD